MCVHLSSSTSLSLSEGGCSVSHTPSSHRGLRLLPRLVLGISKGPEGNCSSILHSPVPQMLSEILCSCTHPGHSGKLNPRSSMEISRVQRPRLWGEAEKQGLSGEDDEQRGGPEPGPLEAEPGWKSQAMQENIQPTHLCPPCRPAWRGLLRTRLTCVLGAPAACADQ